MAGLDDSMDFCIAGKKVRLLPLNETGIEERLIWNTTIVGWKTEENSSCTIQKVDEASYRAKKLNEVATNGRFQFGIYTSLEIYTLQNEHIGFINCYPFPEGSLLSDSVAIGIVIPEQHNRGKGYGSDALRLYTEYLLENHVRAFYLITAEVNHAMLAVGEKCGFQRMMGEDRETRCYLRKEAR